MVKEDLYLTLIKIPIAKYILILQTVVFAFCLPFFIIYYEFSAIFHSLELIKLILISISVGGVCYVMLFLMVGTIIVLTDPDKPYFEEINAVKLTAQVILYINGFLSFIVLIWIMSGLIQAIWNDSHRMISWFGLIGLTSCLIIAILIFKSPNKK